MKKTVRYLLVVAAGIALCGFFHTSFSPRPSVAGNSKATLPLPDKKEKPLDYGGIGSLEMFRLACTGTEIPSAPPGGYRFTDGNLAELSYDKNLQEGLRKFLQQTKTPYAVFVAVEPKTGRVLANVAYSSIYPSWERQGSFCDYPMASLFKVVTTAAAFEAGKATPKTPLAFRGRPCSESPSRWGKNGRGGDMGMPLCDALAHSVNPAFGRLAADRLGTQLLLSTAHQFGFGAYPFGGDFIASGKIPSPATEGELMRIAAGLDRHVTISPFHVAMLFAAIGNKGVMPAPSFVDVVRDPAGKDLYAHKAAPLLTVISPAVADELIRAMEGTVVTGTAKSAFRGKAGQQLRNRVAIAGKTGSITGETPRGHYNWFAGVAPANDPKIAFAALTINGDRWKVKAPQLGRVALELYFRNGGS